LEHEHKLVEPGTGPFFDLAAHRIGIAADGAGVLD